jgi:predicted DNA-binding protein
VAIISMTTIRNSDDLKRCVADAAERVGTTSQNFILEAINKNAEQTERFANFRDVAETRFAALASSGKTIPWDKVVRCGDLDDFVYASFDAFPHVRCLPLIGRLISVSTSWPKCLRASGGGLIARKVGRKFRTGSD